MIQKGSRKMLKIILAIAIICLIINLNQLSEFKISRISFKTDKVSQNIKILQITDFHSNPFVNLDKLLKEIKKLQPDLIVLTGDIMEVDKAKEVKSLFEKLDSLNIPSYAVLGNHEQDTRSEKTYRDLLSSYNIQLLENQGEVLDLGVEKIYITGYRHNSAGDFRKNNPNRYFELSLMHSPNGVGVLDLANVDLILAGHTHGGQVRLPIIGALYAPGQGFLPKYDKGLFDYGPAKLYICSGLGYSALALRFFNPVQISLIEVLHQ